MPLARSTSFLVSRLLESTELPPSLQGHFDGWRQVSLVERLDDVRHHSSLFGPLDQILLTVGSEKQHRGDPFLSEDSACIYPVHTWHLDVHDHDIWLQFSG
jgi:hypothetical protein